MQAWATLEVRRRNLKQARTLFQAALAANKQHAASWHGWGLLEKNEVRLACVHPVQSGPFTLAHAAASTLQP